MTSIGASVPPCACRSLLETCARACAERVVQHVEVADGERQVPERLLDERQLVHDDLRQLRVGQVDGPPRQLNLAPLVVDGAAAEQRLDVRGGERRRELRG